MAGSRYSRGANLAEIAVWYPILVSATLLDRDEPHHDLGADWHSRRNDEAAARYLVL